MMLKKVLIGTIVAVAVFITATFVYWTKQPAYTLSKIISAARVGDMTLVERYIDVEGVSNSIIEEAMRISQEKFPIMAKMEPRSTRATEFFKQMAKSFLRDILNSKTPGFKFKEMSSVTFMALQTKLYFDFFSQKVIAQSEDVVDVSYNLQPLFDKNYLAVFTYKKIGNEWVLFEIKELIPR